MISVFFPKSPTLEPYIRPLESIYRRRRRPRPRPRLARTMHTILHRSRALSVANFMFIFKN